MWQLRNSQRALQAKLGLGEYILGGSTSVPGKKYQVPRTMYLAEVDIAAKCPSFQGYLRNEVANKTWGSVERFGCIELQCGSCSEVVLVGVAPFTKFCEKCQTHAHLLVLICRTWFVVQGCVFFLTSAVDSWAPPGPL